MMVHGYYLLLERSDSGGDEWCGELVTQCCRKASIVGLLS